MPVTSAGILLYRAPTADEPAGTALEVFIAHMGGPYWERRHEGAWTVPKGEYLAATEHPLLAARREFGEEIGVAAPDLEYDDLGEFRSSTGKLTRVYAAEAPEFEVGRVESNLFELEWPPRSGRLRSFPEVDDARWVPIDEARSLVTKGQRQVLDALEARLSPSHEQRPPAAE
ncbi:NUDIX domain-containing protein [Agromyces sp. NPDC058104]|uniref:NUDIX domain-containing protein n=1 Tax=Agromyces sp. NPDC058104 TaxID=3346342 RepID=UPI0036DE5839